MYEKLLEHQIVKCLLIINWLLLFATLSSVETVFAHSPIKAFIFVKACVLDLFERQTFTMPPKELAHTILDIVSALVKLFAVIT